MVIYTHGEHRLYVMECNKNGIYYFYDIYTNGMKSNEMARPFKSNIKLLGINHITFRNKYVIFAYVYAVDIHGIHGIHAIYDISTS